jgi:antirestriction protein
MKNKRLLELQGEAEEMAEFLRHNKEHGLIKALLVVMEMKREQHLEILKEALEAEHEDERKLLKEVYRRQGAIAEIKDFIQTFTIPDEGPLEGGNE